jgi:hypothetical protein
MLRKTKQHIINFSIRIVKKNFIKDLELLWTSEMKTKDAQKSLKKLKWMAHDFQCFERECEFCWQKKKLYKIFTNFPSLTFYNYSSHIIICLISNSTIVSKEELKCFYWTFFNSSIQSWVVSWFSFFVFLVYWSSAMRKKEHQKDGNDR